MEPRLLVRLPSWLGDLVMAEPTVRALWERYSARGEAERLSLAGPAHLLALFDGAFPGARRISHAGRGGEAARAWRGHDAALLLTGSFRAAWTAWRARIARRVGWSRDGRGWLLTDGMCPARERGGTPLDIGRPGRRPRYLPRPFGSTCVELAGLLGVPVADRRPQLAVDPAAHGRMRARLAAQGVDPDAPFLLVNAGARPGSAKAYPRWGEVLAELVLPAVLVGGPGEEEALSAAAPGALVLVDPVADLAELAALCSLAALVLTADAGPRHVAAAVGARVVCVAGPTDPRHTADHLERTRLVRVTVPCGPCHRERCPLAGEDEHRCMRAVAPADVAQAALGFLA